MGTIYNKATPRADFGEALLDFNNDEYQFIAEDVLSVRNVTKKSANYSIISAENNSGNDDTASKGGELNKIDMTAEDWHYNCKKRGLAADVLNEEIDDYEDEFDLELEKIELVHLTNLINKEIRVAAKVTDTTVMTGNKFLDVSATPWSSVDSNIFEPLKEAKVQVWKNCGFVPDSLAVGYETFESMLLNEKVKAMFKDGIVTLDLLKSQLAAVLGIQNLYIGKGQVNISDEGQDYSGSAIWSPNYAVLYKKASGGRRPGFGWSFNWTGNGHVTLGPASYDDPKIDGLTVQEVEYRDEVLHDNGRYGILMQIESIPAA